MYSSWYIMIHELTTLRQVYFARAAKAKAHDIPLRNIVEPLSKHLPLFQMTENQLLYIHVSTRSC